MSIKQQGLSVRKMTIIGMLGAISVVLGLTPLGFIPIGPTRATIMHIPVIIGAILEGPIVGMLVGLIFGLFSIFQAVTNPTILSPLFLDPLVSVLPRVLIGLVAYYSYIGFKKIGRTASTITLIFIWLGGLYYLTRNFMVQLELYLDGAAKVLPAAVSGVLILATLSIGVFVYKKFKNQAIEIVVSAALGTLTNTVGVLSMIYFLHAGDFVEKMGGSVETVGKVIFGIGVTNGIPESIIAMLIVTSVIMGIKGQK